MSKTKAIAAGAALLALGFSTAFAAGITAPASPELGRPATQAEIQREDISIGPDGANLPAGSGSVAQGAATYAQKCAACHGADLQGGVGDRLVGGIGSLASGHPVKTVASYWPYATTVFDYIRRAMPLNAPESLSNDEVYGLVAYILSIDTIVPKDAVLDAQSLAQVKMPNRDGFVNWEPKLIRP